MVWILPGSEMVWGSFVTEMIPSLGKLFLRRKRDPGFCFDIEPKAGTLSRTLAFDTLKDADFNVPKLDQNLRLRTNNLIEAHRYFYAPEKQQALTALFLAGFTRLKGDHGGIIATMNGLLAENISPERIGLFLKHLSSF